MRIVATIWRLSDRPATPAGRCGSLHHLIFERHAFASCVILHLQEHLFHVRQSKFLVSHQRCALRSNCSPLTRAALEGREALAPYLQVVPPLPPGPVVLIDDIITTGGS